MDLQQKFRNTIRSLIGLPLDPGQPPDLMRLGMYRATVMACASDGSTCDVQPEDSRIAGAKSVPVRVGVPGLQAVVQQGAIVLLGWERGDPSRPYCVPHWESTTPIKLTFNANEIDLAGNAYAMVLSTLIADLKTWVTAANTVLGGNCVNGATLSTYAAQATALTAFATSLASPNAYQSTKVKNG